VAGNAEARVSWTAPAAGGAVTDYAVAVSPGGRVVSAGGTATAATITGLTNGTAYTFTVTATGAAGRGAASQRSRPVTPATIPGSPINVRATAGDSQARVSWTPPRSNGGSPVTRYVVTAAPGGRTASVSGTTTTATVTGLAPGTAYSFAVTAASAAGIGATSKPSGPVTPGPGRRSSTSTRPVTAAPRVAATCPTQPVTSRVASSPFVSLAVTAGGAVWAWGGSSSGELGPSGTDPNLWPVQVTGISGITSVSAGDFHALALKSDGTVWAWGSNFASQLGDGTTNDSATPLQVGGLTDVVQVVASGSQSLALRSDGTLWQWGTSPDGAVSAVPVQVQLALAGLVVTVAQSYGHTLVVECDGSVWSWGLNTFGQLGDGSTTDATAPHLVSGLTGVTQVAAGSSFTDVTNHQSRGFSLALRTDGSVSLNANGPAGLQSGCTFQALTHSYVPAGAASNGTNKFVLGGFAGLGPSVGFSNADWPTQLAEISDSWNFNIALGAAQVSVSVAGVGHTYLDPQGGPSNSDFIWAASGSFKLGWGFGLSFSHQTSDTPWLHW
jgi:hypothetical protein